MGNQLALTKQALLQAPNLQELFELDAFRHNFANNIEKTTGRKNGAMLFERERVLFMKAIGEQSEAFAKCDRFTIYAAFIELAVSGLTLMDGQTYIIPYGEKAQFQIGWKGRLEQINQIAGVEFVSQPQLVYTSELDKFEYELGETPRIIKHVPAKDRKSSETNRIEFVYWIIDRVGRKQTFIMDRDEVLKIRDTYSQPYIMYMRNNGVWSNGKPMKKPFWLTNEDEAFKKTIIKRGWKYIPKTARMKALDAIVDKNYDNETETGGDTQDIDYGLENEHGHGPGAQGNDKQLGAANPGGSDPVAGVPTVPSEGSGPAADGGNANSPTPTAAPPKRSHKKKETAPAKESTKVEVGPGGTVADAETHEVLPDVNPAASLPDLSNLTQF